MTAMSATLDGVSTSVASISTAVTNLQQQSKLDREYAAKGIAATAALVGIPEVAQGKKFSLGMGVGSYDGRGAFAVGGSMNVNEQLKMKFGAAKASGSKPVLSAGVQIQW
jgi:trimeric autotransporter adhesin